MTLGELRSCISEAIGDRSRPSDNAHIICWALSQGGGKPMTRYEIMKIVHDVDIELETVGPDTPFSPQKNNSYWSPKMADKWDWERDPNGPHQWTQRKVPGSHRQVPNTYGGHATKFSVLRRGLVELAGKRGNSLLYVLTPEGEKFAAETAKWLQELRSGGNTEDDGAPPPEAETMDFY